MANYSGVGPERAKEYIFYVGLRDQSNTKLFKSSPTIASGDFQVSKDGGTLNNLGTLPSVSPAASKLVKITLSASEMTADNVTVICSDASGSEWCDELINIQTSPGSAQTIVKGTIDTATFTPTATAFEADDITEATADHYKGRSIIFTSGNLKDQATSITAYELSGGKGKFTVVAMTEAPADNDTFVVV